MTENIEFFRSSLILDSMMHDGAPIDDNEMTADGCTIIAAVS